MASALLPIGYARTDRFRLLKHLDGWLIASATILLLTGLMSLFSFDRGNSEHFFSRQLIRALLGLVPFAAFLLLDPKFWRRWWKVMYTVNVVMLVAVLQVGRTAGGAQRWLELGPLDFQPSEMSKLFAVLTLSAFLAANIETIRTFKTFFLSFVHVGVLMALVFKQPHLGATLVLVVGWLSVCLAAGVPARYIVGMVLITLVGLVAAVKTPGVLQPYQVDRVAALLNPDPGDNAFQVERAEVAIGSGGVFGKGFLNGDQKKGGFIPKQQTDFIFTVVGEEGGFIGSVLVLGVFAFFLFRVWLILFQAADPYRRMIAGGLYGMLAFHTLVNLGSILRLLPVVGLWLPFFSYGGTALWLCMACVGLLANIRARERVGL